MKTTPAIKTMTNVLKPALSCSLALLLLSPYITVDVVAFSPFGVLGSRSSLSAAGLKNVGQLLFASPSPPASKNTKKFKNFDELISTHEQPIIVNFHSTLCGPCELLQKELEQVKETMQGKIHVFSIDVERFPSLGTRFKVAALPTLVVFKNGEIVHRIVGVESTESIVRLMSDLL